MLNRFISAIVAVVVAVVALDSFANREDDSDDKNKEDFTPAENEVRHVALNTPFDIAVGQEVLLPDGESRGYLTLVDSSKDVLEFSFVLDGVDHFVTLSPSRGKVTQVAGYMIVLLKITPDSSDTVSKTFGNGHYVARVLISNA